MTSAMVMSAAPGQTVATFRSPLARHNAGTAQIGQDRSEKSWGKALLPRQVLSGLGSAGGGERKQGADAVVDLGRNVHGPILPLRASKGTFIARGGRVCLRPWQACQDSSMAKTAIHLTGDKEADVLLSKDPLALLIGMVLDQQIPLERAFWAPAELARRLGSRSTPPRSPRQDPEEFAELFKARPALHRFPGAMAGRVQAVARHRGGRVRREGRRPVGQGARRQDAHRAPDRAAGLRRAEGPHLRRLLGKQLGVQPEGWRAATSPFGEAGSYISVADITGPESLAKVRAYKQSLKAKAKSTV